MLKKITRIGLSFALLLYSTGLPQASSTRLYPTGIDIGGTQPPASSMSNEILKPGSVEKAAETASNPQSNPEIKRDKNSDNRRKGHATGLTFIGGKTESRALAPKSIISSEMMLIGVKKFEQALSQGYYGHTGQWLVITDGYRTSADQARAILNLLRTYGVRYVLSLYRNKAAIREIVNAYISNRKRRRNPLVAMTRVIEAQVGRGAIISRHMLGRAFDVRSRGRGAARLSILRQVAREMGGTVLVEKNHYHVQL